MTHKISEERINEMLNAFTNGDKVTCNEVVNCFVCGALWLSKYFSEVPMYKKHSLARKAARYIAQTALKGSFEVDALAASCDFCEMEAGYPKTLGDPKCFTFQSKGNKITCILEDTDDKQSAVFTDHNGFVQKVLALDRIYHTSVDRVDLVHMFEDPRYQDFKTKKKKTDIKYIITALYKDPNNNEVRDIVGVYYDEKEAVNEVKIRLRQTTSDYEIYKQVERKGNMCYKLMYCSNLFNVVKTTGNYYSDKL